MFCYTIAFLISYSIGSIPFGLLIGRLFLDTDIRRIGSGNTGATNMLRTGNRPAAFFTMAFDILKPIIAYLLVTHIVFVTWCADGDILVTKLVVSAAAFIGHCYPIYLKFKGGKGIATGCGTLFIFSSSVALSAFLIWVIILAATKKSSLAAIVAAVTVPGLFYFVSEYDWANGLCQILTFYACMIGLVLIRHKDNIVRLMKGTEAKVGFKGK